MIGEALRGGRVQGEDFVIVSAPGECAAAEGFVEGFAEEYDSGGGIDAAEAAETRFKVFEFRGGVDEDEAGELAGDEDGFKD